MTRDHGGNLDAAIRQFGGTPEDWIDLSTGINRQPYPLPDLPANCWTDLPPRSALDALKAAARKAYVLPKRADILPLAGAQAAIQLMPRLAGPGPVGILSPTYNEHAASFRAAGHEVQPLDDLEALPALSTLIVVNPNNPDGRLWPAERLPQLKTQADLLIVDESFIDPTPEMSLTPHLGERGIVTLRSFGKFFGLAGLRLGFALGHPADIAHLGEMAGPWAVNGPAMIIGTRALADTRWIAATRARLTRDAARLDRIATAHGWELIGGTALFRTYRTDNAADAQARLATAHIWSRIFPYSDTWLRLGLPGASEWTRLEAALPPCYRQ